MLKNAVGYLLALITRKPFWAMHPDMDLDAFAANAQALAHRVAELEKTPGD